MKKSRYFSELFKSYIDEVDDLVTDSDGKTVLQKRLNEKRREMAAILPMITFSPEMVAVAFYGAFGFLSPEAMQQIVQTEPDDDDFPEWDELVTDLTVADWARPLIEATLNESGGEAFLVATAGLEFLRSKGSFVDRAPETEPEPEKDADHGDETRDSDEDGPDDLDEAGGDWLTEQGFDTLER